MLFERNIAKGVLSPERFAKLFIAGKIEFSTVTVEEIEDCSSGCIFKTIALEQMLWFVAQCLVRSGQHLNLPRDPNDPSKDEEPDVDHFGEF